MSKTIRKYGKCLMTARSHPEPMKPGEKFHVKLSSKFGFFDLDLHNKVSNAVATKYRDSQ